MRAQSNAITAFAAALRELVAPATHREWLPLEVEARNRGKSTAALREWCLANGVEIRQRNHRDAWVRPAAIDAAIERLPTQKREQVSTKKKRSTTAEEIDAQIEKRRS